MDRTLVFEKTADGEAAVNQRTRLVQRNLRTVLIMVDGVSTVEALSAEIGNDLLVADALRQLQDDGLIRLRTTVEDAEIAEAERHAGHPDIPEALPPPEVPNPFSTAVQSGPAIARPEEEEPATAARFKPVDLAALAARGRPSRALRPATIAAGMAALLVAGFVLLVLTHAPEKHRAAAEALLGGLFGGQAQIGQLTSAGMPPTLVMHNVTVVRADGSQARLEIVRADLGLGVVFGRVPQISTIHVRGASVDAGALAGLALRRQDGSAPPLALVNLSDFSIRAGGLDLPALAGEIAIEPGEGLIRARLHSADALWSVELTPAEGGGARLALSAGEVKGFPATASVLSSAKLSGQLFADGFRVEQIDIRAFDGILEGHADLRWSSGWQLAGQLHARQMDLSRAVIGLGSDLRVEGRANATLKIAAEAPTAGELWSSSQGSGTLEVGTGRILGIDLTDSVRRTGSGPFGGGETRFDHLAASPRWRGGRIDLLDLTLGAGLMTAQGRAHLDSEQLRGTIDVRIGGSAAHVGGTLELSGTSKEPAVIRP